MSSHFLGGLLLGLFVGLPSGILVEKNVPTDSPEFESHASKTLIQGESSAKTTIVQQCSNMDSVAKQRGACPLVE